MCLQNNKLFEKLYILVVAIIILLFCSQCSPLYVTNQWVDSNIYFTIGRGMLEGKLPYIDLYDHKGPVIYFLHYLAAYINSKSFIGVWFIEIICAFYFLYYTYKMLKLLWDKNSIFYIPLIALVVYTSNTFCAGDSAEEICLPVLMYCFYVGMKAILHDSMLDSNESIIVGICLGYVFWLKFTMVGYFIGFALFFLIYSFNLKKGQKFFYSFIRACFGFFFFTTLVLIYFYINNGLDDLFKVYFADNLFSYNNAKNFAFDKILNNLGTGFFSFTYYYYIGVFFVLIGWHYLFYYKKKSFIIFNIACFVFLFLSSFGGGRAYNYYNFVFSIFVPIGIITFMLKLKIFQNIGINFKYVFSLLVCCCAFLLSSNSDFIGQKREDYWLEPYFKIITQKPQATLINYGVMDVGLYNYCNIIPQHRLFCLTNVENDNMASALMDYIENERVDFILAPKNSNFNGYVCAYEGKFEEYILCLYKRIN